MNAIHKTHLAAANSKHVKAFLWPALETCACQSVFARKLIRPQVLQTFRSWIHRCGSLSRKGNSNQPSVIELLRFIGVSAAIRHPSILSD
jgi:hypothetical protein